MQDPSIPQSPQRAPPPSPPPPPRMEMPPPPGIQPAAMLLSPPQFQQVVTPLPMQYQNPYMLPPASYQPANAGGRFPPNHTYPSYERNWSTGLFDCFIDTKICLKTLICPCLTFGQIAEIINDGQTIWYEPTILYTVMAMIGCFTNEVLPVHITFLYTCLYRNKMRYRYGLKGSKLNDCCVHFWCEYCALCQEYRELEQHGFNVSLGWQKNQELGRQTIGLDQDVPPMPQEMTR